MSYSKLDDPLVYKGSTVTIIPMVHRSRFEEEIIYPFHNNQPLPPPPRRRNDYCKFIATLSLVTGIVLMILSIFFKVQSRYYINRAMDHDCPVSCLTICYRNVPFSTCDASLEQSCDLACNQVGIETATTCAILFWVLVSVGGFLVVVQLAHRFLAYCCFDYFNYKNLVVNNNV